MIQKSRHPKGKLFNFVNGLYTILDGLIKVLSIGYLKSDFSYRHIRKHLIKKRIERQKTV